MQYTERIKIALNYAEESSKRARWIVFMLQLTVIIVLTSLWQEADSNWVQKRLDVAQDLVRALTCQPEAVYGLGAAAPTALLKETVMPPRNDPEYVDSKYFCAEFLKDKSRMQRAEKYHKTWGYSLVEAKKNVADLQQIMANRVMGVSIPVLGVVFDINDLSLISGVTFVILLSWFHFALRRQNKNIRHVFYIAEQADLSEREDPVNCLSAAYFLLAMTQVLTIPPSSPAEIGKQTFLRRVSRLPSIIMWTAVIAQFAVVADDFMTMDPGNTLNPTVNYVETGLATALLIYLVIRTSECYRYMTDTQSVWDQALVDAFKSPAERRALARGGRVDFSEP